MSEGNNPLRRQFPGKGSRHQSPTNTSTSKAYHVPSLGSGQELVGSYFAIERGTRHIHRFKLYLRDGHIYSVPYAFLPLIDFDPDERLKLSTSEVDVVIKGRSLETVCDYFNEQRILWIKESGSGIDDDDEPVFISSIEVQEKDRR